MTMPLDIVGWGAVTPIGLTVAQTYAAIRAKVKRFEPVLWPLPTEEPYLGASIPAAAGLQTSRVDWLLNMAARALSEACATLQPNLAGTPVFMLLPRWVDEDVGMSALAQKLGRSLSPASRIQRADAGDIAELLGHAHQGIARGEFTHCLIGASDSLLDRESLEHMQRMNRLYRNDNPQGLLAAEGAAFVLIGRPTAGITALARVLGLGHGREPHDVNGPQYAMGVGLREAIERALDGGGESEIAAVCSSMNGERHAAIEMMVAHARCYRTRREQLHTMLPAACTGEIGLASGVLGWIVAGMAMQREHVSGERICCEVMGEGEGRSAVLVAAGARVRGWYEQLG